jgi:hypothetical protein
LFKHFLLLFRAESLNVRKNFFNICVKHNATSK